MNWLRHNLITLALVVAVAGVTACNSFTLSAYLTEFHMNNADLVAQVAFSESNRCDRLEYTLNRMYRDLVASNSVVAVLGGQLSNAENHIRDCHALLEKAGIQPPDFPLEQCPPDSEKCPFKIPQDKQT